MKLFYKLCYVRDAIDVAYPSSIQGACYHRVLYGSVEEHRTTKLKAVVRFRSSRVNQISFSLLQIGNQLSVFVGCTRNLPSFLICFLLLNLERIFADLSKRSLFSLAQIDNFSAAPLTRLQY